jgi:chemotaxis protein histidine kinase CheA
MAMPSSGASPLPTREGANTITSLQLPSSPPRGQWNSTDEWYQNSLLALRDRDDSDSDGSDREDERQRAERERKQKEGKEKEDRERKLKEEKEEQEKQRKLKEDKEKEEREKREQDERERKAREEKERLERERSKEEKDRAEEEERARRERESKAKSEVVTPLTEDTPATSSEDMREIEQFTDIGKSEDNQSEEKERKEREEAERREREAKEQQEKEQREKEESERRAQQEQREKKQKEEQERQEKERSGLVTKHEVFSDPLSSSLNNPIMDEIFGSGDDSPPPRRQATFDGNIPSPQLPDAPHRRRSGSLTTTAVTPKPPALPPRVHEQQVPSSLSGGRASQPRPVQSASKIRTTSHMFEDFDFSFPSSAGSVATGSPTPAPHSATPPTASFLGLNTPVTSSSLPSPPRPSTASNTDNLFSFSPPTSSTSTSSATKPGAPPKKAGGLFNLDMDDLFNKVRFDHHNHTAASP